MRKLLGTQRADQLIKVTILDGDPHNVSQTGEASFLFMIAGRRTIGRWELPYDFGLQTDGTLDALSRGKESTSMGSPLQPL